jgi:hypothetical protein
MNSEMLSKFIDAPPIFFIVYIVGVSYAVYCFADTVVNVTHLLVTRTRMTNEPIDEQE